MTNIIINTSTTYTVAVGSNIIDSLAVELSKLGAYTKVAIIADSNVAKLYLARVKEIISQRYASVSSYVFNAGEGSKNLDVLADIYDYLASCEITRGDVVIALGGGVTGDMVGFAAATYLRGVDFVNIPTTLLAMVDSSVGGKTAVNISGGKNLVGAFYQPKYVLCDVAFLKTLDKDLIADGIGEIAKYAVLEDRGLFNLLLEGDISDNYQQIVELCIAIKAEYVVGDEFDKGKRQMLNLGHTLGHVIEKDCNFSIHHGKAVMIGMYILTDKFNFSEDTSLILTRLQAVANRFGMDVFYSKSADELWLRAINDKKRNGNAITIVRPYAIGDCRLEKVAVGVPLNYTESVQDGKYDLEIYNDRLVGSITAPPSKSHAHRLLIVASMSATNDRNITVNNVSFSDDILATLRALGSLGYMFTRGSRSVTFSGRQAVVSAVTIDCAECGSTFRFFIPICVMLETPTTFVGSTRLGERGYIDIINALKSVEFDRTYGLPLAVKGKIDDSEVHISGGITSQFISGLMLGALGARRKLDIHIDGAISSRSYIDITAQVLSSCGAKVSVDNGLYSVDCSDIDGSLTPTVMDIESDYSNGAFYNVAGIEVGYNAVNSMQGDKAILDIMEQSKLGYIDCNIDATPDLMPILAVLASTLSGTSYLRNCARLRVKESDRLAVMRDILVKCGVRAEIVGDDMIVHGGKILGGVEVDSCGDHRIAMAVAVLATFAKRHIKLLGAEVVKKSYPEFWTDLARVGGKFNVINIR